MRGIDHHQIESSDRLGHELSSCSLLAEDVGLELSVLNAARVVSIYNLEEGVDKLALNRNLQLSDKVGDLIDGEVTTLVEVEVVEDLLKELGLLAGKLPNAGLDFTEKVRHGLLGNSGVLLLRHLPGGLHHADEVLVAGGAHGKVSVVVIPLGLSDFTIIVTARAIEVVEEVSKDLLTSLAALEELRVHADIVDLSDVLDVNDTRAVTVHHGEGLVHHSLATRGQLFPKFKLFRCFY